MTPSELNDLCARGTTDRLTWVLETRRCHPTIRQTIAEELSRRNGGGARFGRLALEDGPEAELADQGWAARPWADGGRAATVIEAEADLEAEATARAGEAGAVETEAGGDSAAVPGGATQATSARDTARRSRPDEGAIEVRLHDGTEVCFVGEAGIRTLTRGLVKGEIGSDNAARVWGDKAAPEPIWTKLEAIIRQRDELDRLYRPVRHHALKGLAIGAMIGIVLKALDTTWLFFQIDQRVGMLWLLALGSLLVTRWIPFAPLLVIFIGLKSGIQFYQFFTPILGIMAVGFAFGAPLGTATGTLVGLARRGSLPVGADAEREGAKTIFWGLAVPASVFVTLLYLYITWLLPLMLKTLGE